MGISFSAKNAEQKVEPTQHSLQAEPTRGLFGVAFGRLKSDFGKLKTKFGVC